MQSIQEEICSRAYLKYAKRSTLPPKIPPRQYYKSLKPSTFRG